MSMLLLLLLETASGDVRTRQCRPAKEVVFGSLPNSRCSQSRSGLNRIGRPGWVKLCVKLNGAPNQNIYCYIAWPQNFRYGVPDIRYITLIIVKGKEKSYESHSTKV